MRLHRVLFVAAFVLAAGAARAEVRASKDSVADAPKHLEGSPDTSAAGHGRRAKLDALFSTQVQLFLELKDAPTASKTSLRLDAAPRVSSKSKD